MKNQTSKKSFARVLLLAIAINLLTFTAYASGFPDVFPSTPNSEAILYLQDHGIINGYSDGTFKPDQSVNRAELLKIIIEGSKINLDVTTTTPFKDIDYTQWYAPYVEKAYSSGWINGYNDGTFKPTQTITKVEALKIIGKAQNWQLPTSTTNIQSIFKDIEIPSWYKPYVSYAETNNYLEEKGPNFSPTSEMTRGSISEIIYRTIIGGNSSPTTDTSADFGLIAKDSFQNIKLNEDLTNTFYQNEVYTIKGTIVGTNNNATVIVDSKDKTDHKYFTATTTNKHFEIPVYFKNSGDYFLGIVPGDSGDSNAFAIHVNSDLPTTSSTSATTPNSPQNVVISYAKDETSLNFINTSNTLKKFTFTQNNKTVTYLSRQDISSLQLRYGDFENFSAGTINYNTTVAKLSSQSPLKITSAFSQSSNKSFNAVEHSFDENSSTEIQATIPDNLSSPRNLTFTGTAKVDIKSEALVIRPDGNVDQFDLTTNGQTYSYFGQNIIRAGDSFTFNYTPQGNGRYIIELNNKNSEPSINHPIYVGNIIPLIPDFFDLNERTYYKDTFNLNSERTKLLNLINQSRTDFGLDPLILDDQLNTLAQAHSDDMKTNDYFSHYDLNNKTPEDRRIALGINTPVGENIAKDTSVEFAHFGLMRSASHHENILTADWKKVGLGIALDQGELIITEEFSTNPLTTEDLTNFKTDLINEINNLRTSKNLNSLTETDSLNKSAEQINTDNVNGLPVNNQTLGKALDDNSFTGGAQLIGRVGSPWSYLLKSILTSEDSLLDRTWQKIGANIQTDKNGKIYTIVIVGDGN